jgi:hypothetical protein
VFHQAFVALALALAPPPVAPPPCHPVFTIYCSPVAKSLRPLTESPPPLTTRCHTSWTVHCKKGWL